MALARGSKLTKYVLFTTTDNGFKAKVLDFRCLPENLVSVLRRKYSNFVSFASKYGQSVPFERLYVCKDWFTRITPDITGPMIMDSNFDIIER